MTDKELKKLSRIELLELLLKESRENERLREELEQIKKENTIEKSAEYLDGASQQLGEALEKVSEIISNLGNVTVTVTDGTAPVTNQPQEPVGWQMPKDIKKSTPSKKTGIFNILSKDKKKNSSTPTKK